VSSLFRDEVAIYLGASRCALLRTRRGFRSRVIGEKVLVNEKPSLRDWRPMLDVLRDELGTGEWSKADMTVVVADNWLHYELLPWSVELSREHEQLQHAKLLLSGTYGDFVEQWIVSLSEATPGLPRIISAVSRELVDEIRLVAESSNLRLVSVQPKLIAAYNEWRHQIPRESAWFATIDDGSLAALHISRGHCDRVRAVRLSGNWAVELARIQTMGRLAKSSAVDGQMFVEAPERLRELIPSDNSDIRWLTGARENNGTLARLGVVLEKAA
jgi:hypothetical protein